MAIGKVLPRQRMFRDRQGLRMSDVEETIHSATTPLALCATTPQTTAWRSNRINGDEEDPGFSRVYTYVRV